MKTKITSADVMKKVVTFAERKLVGIIMLLLLTMGGSTKMNAQIGATCDTAIVYI